MLILFDHGTPRGLARALAEHTVITDYARGWDGLNNGALLHAAEDAAVDVLLTTDQRMRYQQNLAGRKIALVVLTGTSFLIHLPVATPPEPRLSILTGTGSRSNSRLSMEPAPVVASLMFLRNDTFMLCRNARLPDWEEREQRLQTAVICR